MPGWFETHIHEFFEIYGMAFFILGVVAFVLPRRDTVLPFAPYLGWLAGFGILQGALVLVEGERLHHEIGWLFLLSIGMKLFSFVCLLEFGRRSLEGFERAPRIPVGKLYIVIGVAVTALAFWASNPLIGLVLGVRYLIGVPGAIISSIALVLMLRSTARSDAANPFTPWVRLAAFSMALYAALALVLADSDSSLPGWLPTSASFVVLTGMPVQLARALCAVLLTVAFAMIARHSGRLTGDALLRVANTINGFIYRCSPAPHRNMVFITSGVGQLTGYPHERFLGVNPMRYSDLAHADDRERISAEIDSALNNHQAFELAYRIQHREGQQRWVYERGRGVYGLNGELLFVEGYVTDDTQRQMALQEHDRFSTILDQTLDCVFIFEMDTLRFVYVNDGAVQQLGHSREALLAMHPFDIKPDYPEPVFRELIGPLLEGEQDSLNFETVHRHRDGSDVPVELVLQLIRPDNGLARFISIVRDITARKQASEALTQVSEFNQVIIDKSPVGMAIYDSRGRCVSANDAVVRMIGLPREQVLQQNYNTLQSWQDSGMLALTETAIVDQSTKQKEVQIQTSSGKIVLVDFRVIPFRVSGETHVLVICDDISSRVRVETILHSLAAGGAGLHFDSFLDSVLKGLCDLYDSQYAFLGRVQPDGKNVQTLGVRANGRLAENFEYSLQGTPCQDVLDLKAELIPSGVSELYKEDKMLVEMGIESYFAAPLIGSDGSVIGILSVMDTKAMQLDQWVEPVLEIFATRSAAELERHIATRELEHHKEHLEELVNERTRELREAQDDLVRKERLATLGQLTATVSHELRNPLGAMRPSLHSIQKRSDPGDEKLQQAIGRLERSIGRADQIIDELLDFTRITKLSGSLINLEQWLAATLDEQDIPAAVQQEREFALQDLEVELDVDLMRRAVINVVDNACQSMLDDTGSMIAGNSPCLNISTRLGNDRVEMVFADLGCGMSAKVLEQVFVPLFSTKGFGVGLGMPTVKQIMEQHGGGVEIDSEEGKGTTVTLWLPQDATPRDGSNQ